MQPSKGLNYILSKNKTYYIVAGIGTCKDASIVIPSTYNGKPVTQIGEGAFFSCENLSRIIIPNGITSISRDAFKYCVGLINVLIPSGVTRLGADAFYLCSNLKNIVIPNSLKKIGKSAFCGCKSLERVYYEGTSGCWNSISIEKGNRRLTEATIMYINVNEDDQDYLQVLNDASTDSKTSPIDTNVKDSQTLYIYKGNIRCKRHKHNIISATAKLKNISDQDIVINVEYCTECKKYILSYDLFLHYRDKHHVLIGDLKLVTNEFYDGNIELAEESPLHLCGYNVGQKDDYTSSHRHYILAKLIYDGIMEKQKILDYLSSFVRSRKGNPTMKLAVSKWEDDISFVQQYNISTQPSTIITKVTRY